ncbi:hypothetical protein [Chryseobacterium sp. LAM-KRS1]|uniref:hypothetical protein n=1 Tax=Chryseobacterium sp. LAM-KRS1 TaxID=2715754 RepID=UPI001555D923|nr:hypothetical protein [Chryseobacterium sp. LAM-KRS1]
MKRNKIVLFFLFLSILSCKKEYDKNFSSSKIIFNDITNLDQYDNLRKVEADTLIKIAGSNNKFMIDGYISKKLNKKTGWWNIQDVNKESNKIKIQYLNFENTEKVNQFIFYKNNDIDSTRSKFYVANKSKKNVSYFFCTPKSKETVLSAKFYYVIMDENNNILKESKIESEKNKNNYLFKLEIPMMKKIIIKGLFSEMLKVEDKSLGTNEIFTEDVIEP